MTAIMRQSRKQNLTLALAAAAIFVAGAASVCADGLAPAVVTDPLTGVALDGMDAVSYFTGTQPLMGLPDFEFDWHGVPWYFANAADRDVFIRAPDIYAPQFGGHAAMGLARGFLSDGNPTIYLVLADRLYLFYSADTRDAFELAPAGAIADARKHWGELASTLSADAGS
jgi:hypothetical protein